MSCSKRPCSTSESIYLHLLQREYASGNSYRRNLKILKNIICKGKTTFRKVWEKHSTKHISTEGSNIFFDNYRYFYNGNTLSCSPRLVYTLPSVPTNRKIEDALICHTTQECLHLSRLYQHDCLITITANNHLRLYNLTSGEVLHDLYLSSHLNFRELAWSVDQETLVIRSTHNKMSAFARQAGVTVSIVMVLAVFDVNPLQFIGMIEIDKRTWGTGVLDAMIIGGMLIIMYQSGFVKFFNFEEIVRKYRTDTDKYMVNGIYTNGIPINIKVTECPPVLFEVKCSQHNVQFGGFPWHFIITPHGSLGCFLVYSFIDRQVIKGGHLDLDNNSIELDKAIFHGDESGRIIHIGHDTVRVLEIVSGRGQKTQLEKSFEIVIKDEESEKEKNCKSELPTVTSSGRQIKKRWIQDELCEETNNITVYHVDYENELDVLLISCVISGAEVTKGYLDLYDNYTGLLLHRIQLIEPYHEFNEHKVHMDKDTIIHIVKARSSKFVCTVYKLFGQTEDKSEINDDNDSRNQDLRTTASNRRNRSRTR
ncbi:DDB1- and CUL4-associated factor 17 isoform X1 [Patella vulgata]|uniref:DDB1- and CUL4-associated factor 17 isoform X1 n=2 Tax=Patella vulgata TaxID=6465 RepID=UPI0024A8CDF8|nr:DDB1- and CUL4-associated factor 17 isoform X1 [Patella vulgata]